MSDDGWSFKDTAKALLLEKEIISRHVKEYIGTKKLSIGTGGAESKYICRPSC